jgi:glycosyltransferase involved in cell wall biosynthesis
MKILFALRLYSGLESSVINEKWDPNGIPTIYKLLEGMEKYHEVKVLLFHKIPSDMQYSNYIEKRDKSIHFRQFKNAFVVISSLFNKNLNQFQKIIEELFHCIKLIKHINVEKPDLIYIDNANIWSAGIITRIYKIPVILRLLGIYPYISKLSANKTNIYQKLLKWSFKAPFSLVINTNDGSGKNSDVIKLLKVNTNYKLLINGVQTPKITKDNYKNKKLLIDSKNLVCLFIGKLEIYKGCVAFVNMIIAARKEGYRVHGIIIGEGSQKSNILNMISNSKYKNSFSIIGNITHKDIFYYHSISDLYISLNHLGNMSNTNLEAIKFGQVVIFPKNLPTETDREDIKLFGEDKILWINDPDDINGFVTHIRNINSDNNLLKIYKNNMLYFDKLLSSWDDRIDNEISIIEKLVIKK